MPTPITTAPPPPTRRPTQAPVLHASAHLDIFTYPTGETAGAVLGPIEMLHACQVLVAAYQAGAEDGASTDWSDLDNAAQLAARALGVTL